MRPRMIVDQVDELAPQFGNDSSCTPSHILAALAEQRMGSFVLDGVRPQTPVAAEIFASSAEQRQGNRRQHQRGEKSISSLWVCDVCGEYSKSKPQVFFIPESLLAGKAPLVKIDDFVGISSQCSGYAPRRFHALAPHCHHADTVLRSRDVRILESSCGAVFGYELAGCRRLAAFCSDSDISPESDHKIPTKIVLKNIVKLRVAKAPVRQERYLDSGRKMIGKNLKQVVFVGVHFALELRRLDRLPSQGRSSPMIRDKVERNPRMVVFCVFGPIKRNDDAAAFADEPRYGTGKDVGHPNFRVAQQTVDLLDSVLWHHAVGTGQAAANISDTEAACKHGPDRGLRHRKRTLSMHAWRKKVNQKFGHKFDRNGRVWILVFFVHGWRDAANTKRNNLALKPKFLHKMRGSLRYGTGGLGDRINWQSIDDLCAYNGITPAVCAQKKANGISLIESWKDRLQIAIEGDPAPNPDDVMDDDELEKLKKRLCHVLIFVDIKGLGGSLLNHRAIALPFGVLCGNSVGPGTVGHEVMHMVDEENKTDHPDIARFKAEYTAVEGTKRENETLWSSSAVDDCEYYWLSRAALESAASYAIGAGAFHAAWVEQAATMPGGPSAQNLQNIATMNELANKLSGLWTRLKNCLEDKVSEPFDLPESALPLSWQNVDWI